MSPLRLPTILLLAAAAIFSGSVEAKKATKKFHIRLEAEEEDGIKNISAKQNNGNSNL